MAYVGYVADITHLVALMAQIAEEGIEGDGRTCVAQMGIAVDGRPADIHSDAPLVDRFEDLLLPGQGVIYFHRISLRLP